MIWFRAAFVVLCLCAAATICILAARRQDTNYALVPWALFLAGATLMVIGSVLL